FAGEIAAREELAYPPFGHMAAVRVDHPKESRAEGAIRAIAAAARQHPAARELRVELLGPTPAPLARLRGRYRYRFFLRSVDRRALRGVAAVIARAIDEASSGVRASLDMDPVSMM
ncbi:MAG: primosomal protein N', partial [Myxococcota bacterium]